MLSMDLALFRSGSSLNQSTPNVCRADLARWTEYKILSAEAELQSAQSLDKLLLRVDHALHGCDELRGYEMVELWGSDA